MGNLSAYVTFVNDLDLCKNQKDQLIDQKKKLEEIKAVASKHKSKEEGMQSFQMSTLQNKIENL
jgi:hypothetical protein